jgi:hypothetical protein
MMLEQVIPAIKAPWPGREGRAMKSIVVQQDGASAHISEYDRDFIAAGQTGSWNIQLETQAAKSPDTNILDLSFFRALQSAQWSGQQARNIDELIQVTVDAFHAFDPRSIDFAFLTLQCCIDDILAVNGGNDYVIHHIGKARLLRQNILPQRIPASDSALRTFYMAMGQDNNAAMGDNIGDEGEDNAAVLEIAAL